jgi:hypothetical protein
MNNSMSCSDGRWCTRAADGRLFSVFGQFGVASWFAWVGAGSGDRAVSWDGMRSTISRWKERALC